jgi:protein-S-isoprenylcysteine O-methyltransferase Ste14
MDPNLLRFLLLLFVINLGFQLVRRFREGFQADLPYNVLLAADAGLCVYALSTPERIVSVWSWLAIGIFVGAVLLPAILLLLAQVAMGRAR